MREVSTVPRGRKCDCICPSCGASLVANQGSQKQWYFSHDPRAEYRPDTKCDSSFESACRLFIIDLLKSGSIPVIMTPALDQAAGVDKEQCRPPRPLEDLRFSDSNEYGDVNTELKSGDKKYTLEVFIDYPSRTRPESPKAPDSTGVLAFPVAEVRRRYLAANAGPQVLAGIVQAIFAEAGAGKRWLYHPLIRKADPAPKAPEIRAAGSGILTEQQLARITHGFGGCRQIRRHQRRRL
jgi:hypothetical protein